MNHFPAVYIPKLACTLQTNPQGLITLVSENFLSLLGYKANEIIGKPFKEFFSDPNAINTQAIGSNGNHIPVTLHSYPLLDKENSIQGYSITLTHTKDEYVEKFISSMAHDLRSPLTAILGFSDLLRMSLEGKITEKQMHQLTAIKKSGSLLLELMNDFLEIVQISTGRAQVKIEEASLKKLIDEVSSVERPLAEAKGLNYSVTFPKDDLTLRVDTRFFKFILTTLIHNAIKFTEKGSIEIHVQPKDTSLIIDVIDTGVGIKSEDLLHIFNPFTRDKSNRFEKGTGLNLFISYTMATMLKGRLEVESTPEKGSRFTLNIPIL